MGPMTLTSEAGVFPGGTLSPNSVRRRYIGVWPPPGDGAESGRSPPAAGRVLLDIPLLQGSSTSHDDGAQRACFPESNTFGWRGSTST